MRSCESSLKYTQVYSRTLKRVSSRESRIRIVSRSSRVKTVVHLSADTSERPPATRLRWPRADTGDRRGRHVRAGRPAGALMRFVGRLPAVSGTPPSVRRSPAGVIILSGRCWRPNSDRIPTTWRGADAFYTRRHAVGSTDECPGLCVSVKETSTPRAVWHLRDSWLWA